MVAHELGHVAHDDIPRGLAFVAIVAPLGLLFARELGGALARRAGADPATPAALPAYPLALSLAVLVLSVPGNQLSREVEASADAFALELTDDPQALIDLQLRLAETNLSDPDPPGPRRRRCSAPTRPRSSGSARRWPTSGSAEGESADAYTRPMATADPRSRPTGRAARDGGAGRGGPGRRRRQRLTLERPPKPELGDYSTNAAMLLAPPSARRRARSPSGCARTSPRRLGASAERIEVAGPGLPQRLPLRSLVPRGVAGLLAAGERRRPPATRSASLVEFVSANPTGPLTAAGGRGAAYGDSLARMLEFAGHEVEREYYVNDTGSQIAPVRASRSRPG